MIDQPIIATICGDIATVCFNRPRSLNSFDLKTISMFSEHLINLAADPTVRGVIITGSDKVFCSGGDLKWVYGWPEGYAAALHNLAARYHQSIVEIRRMRKPVVAAINGPAAGGGFSLALACDFRIMEVSAFFKQAYTSAGLSIDGGGTFHLPRIVGFARALEIAAFDKPISSEKALKWGMVTKVVEDGKAMDEANALVEQISRGPLDAFSRVKQLMTDSLNNSLETHLELERSALRISAASQEGAEGLAAFYEKRQPVFNR